jgi:hypothetical protein
VPQENDLWLRVIGNSLAYLCMQHVAQNEPKRVPDMIAKVEFLEGLGIPVADAAQLLGSTANSVKTNLRRREKTKGVARGKKKEKVTQFNLSLWKRSLGF